MNPFKIAVTSLSPRTALALLIFTTIVVFLISIYSLTSGWLTIFQNGFYFPILIACVYYLRSGFVYSVLLTCVYFCLILLFTPDIPTIEGAFIRSGIFILFAGVITHLSERRTRVMHDLVDAKKRSEEIIDFLPDPTFAINKNGNVIAWNRALEQVTGFSASDMIGKGNYAYAVPMYGKLRPTLANLVNSSDEKLTAWYPDFVRNGEKLTAESNTAHVKGKNVILWCNAQPLYDAEGICNGAIESIRDVTLQRQEEEEFIGIHEDLQAAYEEIRATEEELRVNYEELAATDIELQNNNQMLQEKQDELLAVKKQYRDVVEDQTELICRYTPDNVFTFANGAFCRYYGVEPESILGTTFIPTIPASEKELLFEHFSSLSLDNPIASVTHRVMIEEGDIRWQEWTDRAIFTDTGEVQEYQSVGRDCTERMRTEERLRQLRYSLDHIHDLMIVCDSAGTIIEVTPSVITSLVYTQDTLLSMHITDIDTALSHQTWEDIVEWVSTEGSCQYESQYRTETEVGIPVDVFLSSFVFEKSRCYLIVARDISERKAIEEVKQNAYSQIDKNIAQFSILNDQVRNPLTILLILASELDEPLNTQIQKQIAIIDGIIDKLDYGLLESEKVQDFLRKHGY